MLISSQCADKINLIWNALLLFQCTNFQSNWCKTFSVIGFYIIAWCSVLNLRLITWLAIGFVLEHLLNWIVDVRIIALVSKCFIYWAALSLFQICTQSCIHLNGNAFRHHKLSECSCCISEQRTTFYDWLKIQQFWTLMVCVLTFLSNHLNSLKIYTIHLLPHYTYFSLL